MMRGKISSFVLFSLLAFASLTAVAKRDAFTYQGVLRDSHGGVVENKNYAIEFRLYDCASGGVPVWGTRLQVLLDDEGLFSVPIEDNGGEKLEDVSNVGLSEVIAKNAGRSLYIGLKVVGSREEIVPRQKIFASPYASIAANAATAGGDMHVASRATAKIANIKGDLVVSDHLTVTGHGKVRSVAAGNSVMSPRGVIPIGGIITWSGAVNKIPYGWALCDGNVYNARQTPDLRSRFIVGGGGHYSAGDIGGEATHALTVSEMPSHVHAASVKTVGYALSYNKTAETLTHDGSERNNGNKTVLAGEAGASQAHENRPPYYALCYIMRVR
jgi:microcystin-dependent protein